MFFVAEWQVTGDATKEFLDKERMRYDTPTMHTVDVGEKQLELFFDMGRVGRPRKREVALGSFGIVHWSLLSELMKNPFMKERDCTPSRSYGTTVSRRDEWDDTSPAFSCGVPAVALTTCACGTSFNEHGPPIIIHPYQYYTKPPVSRGLRLCT